MKLLKITDVLISNAPLSGVKIDEIGNMLDTTSPHRDIRFENTIDGDFGGGYDIVGDRWETQEEARRRLDKKKKEREAKKKKHDEEIRELEARLAKLLNGRFKPKRDKC